MKTRIAFYDDNKTANEVFNSRRKLMFALNDRALQGRPKEAIDTFDEHFEIADTPIENGQDVSQAILSTISDKLQLDKYVDADDTDIDVLKFTVKEKNIYYILIRMPSYQFSVDGQSFHIKDPVDIVYKVSKDKDTNNYIYSVNSFETDRIDIYNLVMYNAEQRRILINEIISDNERKKEYEQLQRKYPKLHHEIRLKNIIDQLPEAYHAIKVKALNLLNIVHKIKCGNRNTEYIQEIDVALRCTYDYLSTLPLMVNDESESVLNDTYKHEMGEIANKFEKSVRNDKIAIAITALVTVAVITVCVLAIVLSWGGAAIPIAAMFVVACAGGSYGMGLFYHAKGNNKVAKETRELHEAPQLS